MSSPNGRKKFEEIQNKRRAGTDYGISSAKARRILDENMEDEDDEDDEETLQLKLAAIEARLKLKKLQQSKARLKQADSETESFEGPSGIISPRPDGQGYHGNRLLGERKRKATDMPFQENIQVPLSPIKRPPPLAPPVSPQRVILGIDKGRKAPDVSLRRPKTLGQNAYENKQTTGNRAGNLFTRGSSRETQLLPPDTTNRLDNFKSFSDRMLESRANDKERRDKSWALQRKRTAGFGVDKNELERFHAAVKESTFNFGAVPTKHERFTSPVRAAQPSSTENIPPTSPSKRDRGQLPGLGRSNSETRATYIARSESSSSTGAEVKPADPTKFEPFSSLHLSTRILPHSFLKRTLDSKTTMRIPDLLRTVKGPDFESPEIEGDFVVFGIVGSKSAPKEHKEKKIGGEKNDDESEDGHNANKYMVLTLTDLKWTIDLFLFSTAFPRYYRLAPGTLIAVLNPAIMPPPRHKLDTNAFSLTLHSSEDTILEIGTAQDIGFCKAVKRDGKVCESWIDSRKTEYCDFHIEAQLRKTTSGRMEVNSGPGISTRFGSRFTGFRGAKREQNGFQGNRMRSNTDNGGSYDRATGTRYYVAPAATSTGGNRQSQFPGRNGTTSSLLDADDPFIDAGSFDRGGNTKAERLRKRLADQERERTIARSLGEFKGVGAEYLRAQHKDINEAEGKGSSTTVTANSNPTNNKSGSDSSFGNDPFLGLDNLQKNAKGIKLKRGKDGNAQTTVKKTRFITANGIREAGRDSLGRATRDATDYNDDLDIV
ncbi:DNA replication licensing factor mcm10 [Nannizzia gypsea CBS 118893]|uniref:DNA replication licensing factor mcm10 n=1 Tax=Arthroderma gypseum (strain ATCC MYA-4604 / CBS 118893) TaxID=535722 RepID=E5QZN3_ARTGP|nr:DNA replication licensing factor mcm10 [Nannizzia gypsea CBS 118893]EFQ98184.1 DNA replication licensing factor mcm10 [Nannizzia gypsea CBS 118893]